MKVCHSGKCQQPTRTLSVLPRATLVLFIRLRLCVFEVDAVSFMRLVYTSILKGLSPQFCQYLTGTSLA